MFLLHHFYFSFPCEVSSAQFCTECLIFSFHYLILLNIAGILVKRRLKKRVEIFGVENKVNNCEIQTA